MRAHHHPSVTSRLRPEPLSPGSKTKIHFSAIALALILVLGACFPTTPAKPGSSSAQRPLLGSSAQRDVELNPLTAAHVVHALTSAGLPAPYPLDTTAYECRVAKCEQSIVTDTLRVKSFDTADAAAKYAEPRGLNHISTFVVSFAPPLSQTDRQRYWSEITRLVQ
jgi:hypothetical protein